MVIPSGEMTETDVFVWTHYPSGAPGVIDEQDWKSSKKAGVWR